MLTNIDKDILLNLIKATRMSLRLAKDTRTLLLDQKGCWTVSDQISGFLTDALYAISGERITPEQDFWKHSKTMKLLLDDTSDEEATERLMALWDEWHPKQPAPVLMTREQREALYSETPEGEWR